MTMSRPFPNAGGRMSLARFALALSLVFAFCLTLTTGRVYAQNSDTLDINATIHVTVAGEPDVSGDFVVDTNGDISMLYINQVHVAGLTVEQTRKKIATNLAKYIRNPQVVVKLVNIGGIGVEVTGAVSTQGSRALRSDTHLNEVLQQALPALDADLTKVQITHGRPGETHTTDTVNYLAFLNAKDPEGNPLLRDYDKVYVPRKDIPIEINIRGQVSKPGRISVGSKNTVFDALQAAGGLTLGANKKTIVIQHANSLDKIPFDYDIASQQTGNPAVNPILLEGDTIIVDSLPSPSVYTITGGVLHPAEFPLDKRLSLADAIGIAGGTSDGAKLKDTTILRTDAATGRTQIIKVDASNLTVQGDTLIQAGDNITIPPGQPKPRYDPLTILGAVGSIIGIFSVLRR